MLRRNGCTIERTHVRITGDCLDRYRISVTRPYPSYPVGFLSPGTYYEVRVIFYSQANPDFWYAGLEGPSSTHTVFIPNRTPPTPTPRPTATPKPTPTPRPTATPQPIQLPRPTRAGSHSASGRDGLQQHAKAGGCGALRQWNEAVPLLHPGRVDMGRTRGADAHPVHAGGGLLPLGVRGDDVNGHALTCANSSCMNVVIW